MSYTRKCGYCGRWFEAKRPHATYCKDRCRSNAWERDGFDTEQDALQRVERGDSHPLQAVREEQERDKEKARWTLMCREHLARTLLATGYAHADDFDALGVPDDHRNVIGSQMGSFVSRGWMVEVSRRPSANPKRKGAKSAVYQLSDKGRNELQKLGITGVDVDHHGDGEGAVTGIDAPAVGVDPGEPGAIPTGAAGVGPHPDSDKREAVSPPLATDAGQPDSSEQLFKTLPSAYADVWEGEAA